MACSRAGAWASGGEDANAGCAGRREPAEAPRRESTPHGRDQQQQPHRIADQTWQNEEDGSDEGETPFGDGHDRRAALCERLTSAAHHREAFALERDQAENGRPDHDCESRGHADGLANADQDRELQQGIAHEQQQKCQTYHQPTERAPLECCFGRRGVRPSHSDWLGRDNALS